MCTRVPVLNVMSQAKCSLAVVPNPNIPVIMAENIASPSTRHSVCLVNCCATVFRVTIKSKRFKFKINS